MAASLPERADLPLSFLGQGWDFRMFALGERWLLRAPKRAECVGRLDREEAALAYMAPRLPLPIPRCVQRFPAAPGLPHGIALYARVPGEPALGLDRIAPSTWGRSAQQLGGFLRALHALPVEPLVDAGVAEEEIEPSAVWRAEVAEQMAAVRGLVPPETAVAFDALLVEPPRPTPAGPLVAVHADMDAGHVLLDPASGDVSGVIDWGDLALGPAELDLVGLYQWRGRAFAQAAAAGRGLDLDWVRQIAALIVPGAIQWAERTGRPAARAFWIDALGRCLAD